MRVTRSPALAGIFVALSFACANALASPQEPRGQIEDLSYFIGSWVCHGVFPSNGKTIDSTMTFAHDLAGASIVKRHDDTSPPALYHAIELWGYSATQKRFNAAIQDNFGGIRDFTSPGWIGNSLTWTSAQTVMPLQEFAYTKRSPNSFNVDWMVSRSGANYAVGDTLTCTRQST